MAPGTLAFIGGVSGTPALPSDLVEGSSVVPKMKIGCVGNTGRCYTNGHAVTEEERAEGCGNKMIIKRLIFTVTSTLLYFLSFSISAQELQFIVVTNTPLYNGYYEYNGIITELAAGEIVYYSGGKINYDNIQNIYRINVRTEKGDGWINVHDLNLPNLSPGAFSDNLTSKIWVYNYYVDVLKSKDRKTMFKYEPFWENTYYDKYFYPPYPNEWYEYAGTPEVMFFSGIFAKINILSANTIKYIITDIKINKNSITAGFLCIHKEITYAESPMIDQFELWKTYEFRMVVDGDYLDVYIGNIKLITLITVDQIFINEFKSLDLFNNL